MSYNFKKIAAMAIISMTVVSAITGCSQATDMDSAFQTLDVEQLDYEEDDIIFLRNDNVYKGDLYDGDDTIGLPPGIYKVISEKIEGHDSDLGEIYLLTPGEAVIMNVDYTSLKATITNDENTK